MNDMLAELAKLTAAIKALDNKTDRIGEMVNSLQDLIMSCSTKIDFLSNSSQPVHEATKAAKPAKSTTRTNIAGIFKQRYMVDQSAWDTVIASDKMPAAEFKSKLLSENKAELDALTGDKRVEVECSIIYKGLSSTQKSRLSKYIKQNAITMNDPPTPSSSSSSSSSPIEQPIKAKSKSKSKSKASAEPVVAIETAKVTSTKPTKATTTKSTKKAIKTETKAMPQPQQTEPDDIELEYSEPEPIGDLDIETLEFVDSDPDSR